FRARCFAGAALCAALIGFAIFSQFQWELLPCPLCIFQRIAFAVLGVLLLIAGLHAPRGVGARRAYGVLALIPTFTGLGIAARHVWLTHLPPEQVPSCGPPLEFMMETNAFTDVIRKVLTGSGECARVDWTFLGLSMPAWSLLWFVLLALLVVTTTMLARR
ncbi:MAG: disulfide bond formation protein B, partial [Luteimonas sp.]